MIYYMKLIPLSKAKQLLASNPTLKRVKYCKGKYDWSKRESLMKERQFLVSGSICAIWLERRQDKHGPYGVIYAAKINRCEKCFGHGTIRLGQGFFVKVSECPDCKGTGITP